ncbi:hypothetical protein PsAD26_04170 [Pseudovibrio sp. Ad26]|nr:hypothetical protein PsAD26_04170 [Pseudovibrio sp. Ad26]
MKSVERIGKDVTSGICWDSSEKVSVVTMYDKIMQSPHNIGKTLQNTLVAAVRCVSSRSQ